MPDLFLFSPSPNSSPPLPIPCLLFPPLFRSLSSCLCIFYLPPFLSSCLFLWVKTASLVNIASSLKKPRRGLLELSRTCASISLIWCLQNRVVLFWFLFCLWLNVKWEGVGKRQLEAKDHLCVRWRKIFFRLEHSSDRKPGNDKMAYLTG